MKPQRLGLLVLCAVAAVAIAAPGVARAEDPPPPRAPEPTAVTQPYALYIVLADVTALALLLSGQQGLQALAAGSYLLTPPILHLVHGRPGRAAGSLGLRLLLPGAGGAIGTKIEDCSNNSEFLCGFTGLLLGGLAGVVVASIVDAAVLADTSPGATESTRPPLAKLAGLELDHAGVAPQRNGGVLVLGGRF